MLVYAKKAASAGERMIITKYYFRGSMGSLGHVIYEYRKEISAIHRRCLAQGAITERKFRYRPLYSQPNGKKEGIAENWFRYSFYIGCRAPLAEEHFR